MPVERTRRHQPHRRPRPRARQGHRHRRLGPRLPRRHRPDHRRGAHRGGVDRHLPEVLGGGRPGRHGVQAGRRARRGRARAPPTAVLAENAVPARAARRQRGEPAKRRRAPPRPAAGGRAPGPAGARATADGARARPPAASARRRRRLGPGRVPPHLRRRSRTARGGRWNGWPSTPARARGLCLAVDAEQHAPRRVIARHGAGRAAREFSRRPRRPRPPAGGGGLRAAARSTFDDRGRRRLATPLGARAHPRPPHVRAACGRENVPAGLLLAGARPRPNRAARGLGGRRARPRASSALGAQPLLTEADRRLPPRADAARRGARPHPAHRPRGPRA